MRDLFIFWASAALILPCLSSCAKLSGGNSAQNKRVLTVEEEQKLWWTSRVATTLASGRPRISEGELEILAQQTEDEIVDKLMMRPEFKDTMVAFGLEYLGFRSDKVKLPDGSPYSAYFSLAQYPSVFTAANAVADDGDFFKILDLRQPVYAPPLASSADERKVAFDATRQMLRELAAGVAAEPSMTLEELCKTFALRIDFNRLAQIGLSADFAKDIQLIVNPVGGVCMQVPIPPLDAATVMAASLRHWDELEAYVAEFDRETYKVPDASSLKTFDLVKLGFASEETRGQSEERYSFGWFWKAMANSSTNYNRKRAAYALKRFFCDDLTPIAVETPAVHAEGKHATEPGCQACHYKLDPMAGFFRYNGRLGENYEASPSLTFDDYAQVDTAAYARNWQRADGSLNIGYIRSVNEEARNDRGAHPSAPRLQDLLGMVASTPEGQQCLVKTMARFLIGENTTLDAGYLEYLGKKFTEASAASTSGRALKATMKDLLLSKSFRQTNPVESVCYDYAPGIDPAGLPPCKIARVLAKNCGGCHGGAGAQGGLNLSSWQLQSDGVMGFDSSGAGAMATFQTILDRLGAADEDLRMPLKKYMTPVEREEIFLWVSEQLSAKDGRP